MSVLSGSEAPLGRRSRGRHSSERAGGDQAGALVPNFRASWRVDDNHPGIPHCIRDQRCWHGPLREKSGGKLMGISKLLLGSAVIALASAVAAQAETPKDTVVMAKAIDDIISLDPGESFEFSGGEVVGNMYEKLLYYDVKNVSSIYGALAESWSVGNDGKTYTFKLRPGIKFSSGNPLTADDAVYSIQRAVILNKAPGFILTQFGINKDNATQRVRATDAMTVVVETEKAVAPTFFYYCLTAGV